MRAWPIALLALALQCLFITHLLLLLQLANNPIEEEWRPPIGVSPPFPSPYSVFSSLAVPKAGIESKLVTTSTDPPFHMFVYPDNIDKYISRNIAARGIYEPSTTKLIYRLIPKCLETSGSDDCVAGAIHRKFLAVDLGSNLGYYSLLLASRGMRVVSFEASPDTAWLQRSSIALNGFVPSSSDTAPGGGNNDRGSIMLVDRGVTDEPSTKRLMRRPDSPGMTSFSTVDKFHLRKGASGTALDVDIRLVRAGDTLEELGIAPSTKDDKASENDTILHLLKIDVEGFELKALRGLDLERYKFRHILMEYFPDMLRAAGTDPPYEVLRYILSHGYKMYEMVTKGKKFLREIDIGGDDAKGLSDWAEMAEKRGLASIAIEDLEEMI